jgi:membrane-bound ClpP family serine protease
MKRLSVILILISIIGIIFSVISIMAGSYILGIVCLSINIWCIIFHIRNIKNNS